MPYVYTSTYIYDPKINVLPVVDLSLLQCKRFIILVIHSEFSSTENETTHEVGSNIKLIN